MKPFDVKGHGLEIAIGIAILVAAIAGHQYGEYERAEAARETTIETQTKDIASLKNQIQAERNAAQKQVADLAKQSKALDAQPSLAPILIRETIPLSEPLRQTAPITIDTLPDAPVAQVTKQQEIELAHFGSSCKQCSIEREQLRSQVAKQQDIIDHQKTELAAAENVSKGSTLLKRTLKVLKVTSCGAGGAVIGSLAGKAKGAAIGSAAGSIGCTIF
jgi:Tfp pilus assembly major pilin PilA